MLSGTSMCPRCSVASSPPIAPAAGPAPDTPSGSPPSPPQRLSPSTPAAPTPTTVPTQVPPADQHVDISPLKIGIRLQAAAAVTFIASLIMDSYSVTTYYTTGQVATHYPLLPLGLFIGAIALIVGAIGTIVTRRAKAERLARLTSVHNPPTA